MHTQLPSKNQNLLLRTGGVDWHCHILPGIDDGSRSLEESLEIGRILSNAGFKEVYCTPHAIRGLYDNTPDIVRRAVKQLQSALDQAGIPLQLHQGMEYFIDEFFLQRLSDPLPLGNSRFLLVETSPAADPEQVKEALFSIRRRGLTPLLAHPERYSYIGGEKRKAKKNVFFNLFNRRRTGSTKNAEGAFDVLTHLRQMNCCFQANLGSFAGNYGTEVQSRSQQILALNYYSCYGSDAHRAETLESLLARSMTLPVP